MTWTQLVVSQTPSMAFMVLEVLGLTPRQESIFFSKNFTEYANNNGISTLDMRLSCIIIIIFTYLLTYFYYYIYWNWKFWKQ